MDVSSLIRKNIYPGDACLSDWFKGKSREQYLGFLEVPMSKEV